MVGDGIHDLLQERIEFWRIDRRLTQLKQELFGLGMLRLAVGNLFGFFGLDAGDGIDLGFFGAAVGDEKCGEDRHVQRPGVDIVLQQPEQPLNFPVVGLDQFDDVSWHRLLLS
jgi:hypothetical protein